MKTKAQQFISSIEFYGDALRDDHAQGMLTVFAVARARLDDYDEWTLADGSRVRRDDYGFASLGPAPAAAQPGMVEAFFAVSLDRPGNSNGYIKADGLIAAERGGHALSANRDKAQRAANAYEARDAGRAAAVRSTWCFPQFVGGVLDIL